MAIQATENIHITKRNLNSPAAHQKAKYMLQIGGIAGEKLTEFTIFPSFQPHVLHNVLIFFIIF